MSSSLQAPLQPSSLQPTDSSVATTTQPSAVEPDTGHFADSMDVTTTVSSHILDMPVQCDVAPLQPSVSQLNIKDPLICGATSGNLSFELVAQEGKYYG